MESLLVEGIVFLDNVLTNTDNGIKLMILYEDKYLNQINYDLIFEKYFECECYTNEELIKIKNMIDELLKNPFIDITTFNILLNKIDNEIKLTNDLIDKYNNLLNINYDKLSKIGYIDTEKNNKIKEDLYNFKNKYNKLILHKIKNNNKTILYRLYGQQYFEIKFTKFLILKDIKLINLIEKELENINIKLF